MAVEPRQLDRGLVGLGAGVAEKYPVHAGRGAKPVGQLLLPRNLKQVGGMQQARGLVLQGAGQRREIVPEAGDRDAAQRVEVAAAVLVPEVAAVAVGEADRQ